MQTQKIVHGVAIPILIIISNLTFAQRPDSLFQSKSFSSVAGQSLPYRLFVPTGYDRSKSYPLVLWLHGSNGRGTDNSKNISGGNKLGSHIWTYEANQKKNPCFVLAPQCPDTALWVSNDGIDTPPDELDAVVALLTELRHTYAIDTNRIYVAGQSMGGVAVWEIIARYPTMFAAALPLCGIGNTDKAAAMVHIPVWAFHGTADSTVPVAHSRAMIDAIKHAGGNPRYTEYKNVGHDVWKVAFKERDLLPWVFTQHRGK